jgi:hypothetical protein
VYVSWYLVKYGVKVRTGCPKKFGLLSEEGGDFVFEFEF